MTTQEFRAKYWKEVKSFLESEAGNWFRVTLSKMRPQGSVTPIPGVDYSQLCAAAHAERQGYEHAVVNVSVLGTPPEPPEKQLQVRYSKTKKGKSK